MDSQPAGQAVIDRKDRRVCSECVDDDFLRNEIGSSGQDGACFYCEQAGKTFSLAQLADLAGAALSELFVRVDPNQTVPTEGPRTNSLGIRHFRGRHRQGRPVADVLNDAGMGYVATEDVLLVLAERQAGVEVELFAPDGHYASKESVDTWDFETGWIDFEHSLKTEARYFNRFAEFQLGSIFEGINDHKTSSGRGIVVELAQGEEPLVLYRARVFQDMAKFEEAVKHPDREVGPPPPSGAVAGRMNAAGISVFYGATNRDVALAEVQPPVGSKVLVAGFEVIRPLRLLDLTALDLVADEQGSIFDPGYIYCLKRAEFLRGLSRRISRPVMPANQPRDYLPTQAIADYLATAINPPLDGIIYPSVQAGPSPRLFGHYEDNRNVVLFHKTARVRPLEIPEGAEISVFDDCDNSAFGTLDDGPEAQYTVWEDVDNLGPVSEFEDSDDVPLRLTLLEVHHVRGVKIDSVSSEIRRYRAKKRDAGPANVEPPLRLL